MRCIAHNAGANITSTSLFFADVTHIIALEDGQSSQETSEPITPVPFVHRTGDSNVNKYNMLL